MEQLVLSAVDHNSSAGKVLNDIEHTKTKAIHPQTNGLCERFHKTIINEFYKMPFRRKIYRSIEELQVDLNEWLANYNNDRTHGGRCAVAGHRCKL